MRPNGLPRTARLHLKRDFEHIIQAGAKYQANGLVLWCRNIRKQGPVRIAVVVSKKLGPAVVRNRTKRILREVFRTYKSHLIAGTDIIVNPRNSETLSQVQAAQQTLTTLCKQAALVKENLYD